MGVARSGQSGLLVEGLVVALLMVGCAGPGAAGDDPPAAATSWEPSVQPELTATATVLEERIRKRKHGPQLCLGGVLTSFPPQCGGPDVPNWDWSTVPSEELRGGTRWGVFTVVGHYDADADTFTLTRPAAPPTPTGHSRDTGWHTPCPEPDGGWRVRDPDRTSEASLNRALRSARQLSDYAGAWVDQSINPAVELPADEAEGTMNDPALMILNVAVTGDIATAERDLREAWGGALCVSTAAHTEAELRRIARDLSDTPGLLGSSYGNDHVSIQVVYDHAGALQAQVDSRYGPGVVRVASALHPVTNPETPTAQS